MHSTLGGVAGGIAHAMRREAARGVLPVPFGTIHVYADERTGLSAIELSLERMIPVQQGAEPVITAALEQLEAYFAGDLDRGFQVPIHCRGTPFQCRVWDALRAIAPGCTVSYGSLAAQLGSSARAVAGACRANPLPIVIPCHRVVGSSGLGGYCGATDGPWLDVKRWLLRHEQSGGTRRR